MNIKSTLELVHTNRITYSIRTIKTNIDTNLFTRIFGLVLVPLRMRILTAAFVLALRLQTRILVKSECY